MNLIESEHSIGVASFWDKLNKWFYNQQWSLTNIWNYIMEKDFAETIKYNSLKDCQKFLSLYAHCAHCKQRKMQWLLLQSYKIGLDFQQKVNI